MLCPFHSDSEPSASVNTEIGAFKCFACGVTGDAIGLVMDYYNLTYPEAVEKSKEEFDAQLINEEKKSERVQRRSRLL